MTSKERVLERERQRGKAAALNLAVRAPEMTGTAIIAEQDHVPNWNENAVYKAEHIGFPVQDNDQVYTILQPHTPAHNPGSRPADLPAIYSIKHTTDPVKAKPYMAPNGTSGMYMTGDCCTYNGRVWRSDQDNNIWVPGTAGVKWIDIGPVEEVFGK
ncbi:MAG: hypothetical protein IKK92_01985 [Prevotella sp.]|nr:hypothetical protein [Prevotella sp.]